MFCYIEWINEKHTSNYNKKKHNIMTNHLLPLQVIQSQFISHPPLNCLCHLYGSIYHRMHNWAPHRFVYSKVYIDIVLFLFEVCLRDLFIKNEGATCYARSIHWKEALAPGQFSNRAILSYTMTGKNRHTSFVNRLNFKSCISHSVGFQQLLYTESALWTRPGSTSG